MKRNIFYVPSVNKNLFKLTYAASKKWEIG
jgi:hypothetical protein